MKNEKQKSLIEKQKKSEEESKIKYEKTKKQNEFSSYEEGGKKQFAICRDENKNLNIKDPNDYHNKKSKIIFIFFIKKFNCFR